MSGTAGELIREAIEGWLADWRWVRESAQAAAAGRRLIAGSRGLEAAGTDRGPVPAERSYDQCQLAVLLGVGTRAEGAGALAAGRGWPAGGRYGAGAMLGKLTGAYELGSLAAGLRQAGAGEKAGNGASADSTDSAEGRQAAFVAAAERAKQALRSSGGSSAGAALYYGGYGGGSEDSVNDSVSGLAGAEADLPAGAGGVIWADRAVEPGALAEGRRAVDADGFVQSGGDGGDLAMAVMRNEPAAGQENSGRNNSLNNGLNNSLNRGLNKSLNSDLNEELVGGAQLAKLLLVGPALAANADSQYSLEADNEADNEANSDPGPAVAREAAPGAWAAGSGRSAQKAGADLTERGAVDLEKLAAQVADRLQEGLAAELYSRSFAGLE